MSLSALPFEFALIFPLTSDCWIGLIFFPQTEYDHERRNESNHCEAKPHEAFAEWSIGFGDVTDSMQC